MNELDADVKRALIILVAVWWSAIIGIAVFALWLALG